VWVNITKSLDTEKSGGYFFRLWYRDLAYVNNCAQTLDNCGQLVCANRLFEFLETYLAGSSKIYNKKQIK